MSFKPKHTIKKKENGKVTQRDLVRIPVATIRSSRMENLISQFSKQNPEPDKKISPKKKIYGHKYSKSVSVSLKGPSNNKKKNFDQFSNRKDLSSDNKLPICRANTTNKTTLSKNKKKKIVTNRQGVGRANQTDRKNRFASTVQRFNSIALGEKIILQNKTKLTPVKPKPKRDRKKKKKKKTKEKTKKKTKQKTKKKTTTKKRNKTNEKSKVKQASIKNVLDIAKQLESKPLAGRGLSLSGPISGKKLKKMSKKSKHLHEKQEKEKKKKSKKKKKEQEKQFELQKRKEKEKEREEEKRKRKEEKRKKKEEERVKKEEKKLKEKELQTTTLQFSEQELVGLILHPNKEALDLIIKTLKKLKKCDTIVLLILQIFEAFSITFELINYCLKEEIKTTKNFENLFRSNTFTTKLTTASGKMYGRDYIIETLKEPINNVVEDPENLEIDPNQFDEDISFNFLELNCQRMQDKTYLFLQSIYNNESQTPNEIRELCYIIRNEVKKTFPNMELTSVGGFIFLRIFCVYIASPTYLKITTKLPDKQSRKALVQVTKLIQSLSNNTRFNNASYMNHFNLFLDENEGPMNGFLENISEKSYMEEIKNTPSLFKKEESIQFAQELKKILQQNFQLIGLKLNKIYKNIKQKKNEENVDNEENEENENNEDEKIKEKVEIKKKN
ncbi:neurofibromin [Anaeramoeba flamelloides]|uniref:Neurofibromin n=1 Tax=Anaeramoeba flamelloides TaxID=1746091 RepID=A0ABQ8X7F6_9EUKA|nr:neurofibromin [Anaeramoeba flamelloides]